MGILRSTLLCLAVIIGPAARGWAAPAVTASLKPLHSLTAAVMQGAGEPVLLVQGAASPHGFSLRPSHVRALYASDLVVRAGPGVDGFLDSSLENLPSRTRVLDLSRLASLERLPARTGGAWEGAHAEHGHLALGTERIDPHFWLDPRNAQVFVAELADRLAALDPDRADAYRANAAAVHARLAALDEEIAARVEPVRSVPYVVFHDAFQYFEHRYRLNALGAVAVSAEQRPGARRVQEIRARLRASGARCVFREPQFEGRLLAALTEGLPVREGVLDPIGADLAPGPQAYFTLLRQLAQALVRCLAGG